MKRGLVTTLLVLLAASAAATEISVQVRDAKGRTLADAVVWAIPADPAPPTDKATAVMDQKNRTFVPHVLPVQRGTAVRFPNSDNVRHQVYSFSPPKTFQLPLYIGEPANPVIFDKSGVVSIGCNIHDQMAAWIIVVDTPHFGKSSTEGTVSLKGLGKGAHEIHAWHPTMAEPFDPLAITLDGGDDVEEISVRIRTD